jgi:hypothetical protein
MCAAICVPEVIITGMENALLTGVVNGVAIGIRPPVLVHMSEHTDVLGQMRNEWQYVGRTPRARASLEALRSAHPELALEGARDLRDVVCVLEARSGRTVIERAAIIQALLESAVDPELHRTLLQTLIPGIVSACRQLRFGDGIIDDPSETVAMALSLTSDVVSDWCGESRQYAAPDILSAVRGRLRRWLLKEKQARRLVTMLDQVDVAAYESSPLLTRLQNLRGGQYDRLASLTYARVFEGRSLHDVATHDHSSPASLQKELQRFAINFLL